MEGRMKSHTNKHNELTSVTPHNATCLTKYRHKLVSGRSERGRQHNAMIGMRNSTVQSPTQSQQDV
jgi:hypothetical protein